jgi:catechol 2,3-dioxygenase-like lactoylglutathione lyase family enzyme
MSLSDFIKLSSVTLDCPNARELAAFYADITGGRVIAQNDAWATVDGPGGRIDFQTVPGYTNSNHCYVYADPVGHPFCLSTWNDVPDATSEGVPPPATAAPGA